MVKERAQYERHVSILEFATFMRLLLFVLRGACVRSCGLRDEEFSDDKKV